MALNFPPVDAGDNNPTNGTIWTDPNTKRQWIYDSTIPGWRGLPIASNNSIRFRGSINLNEDPTTQFSVIESGDEFAVSEDSTPVTNAAYVGIIGKDVHEGDLVIFSGDRWHLINKGYPYATEDTEGVIKLATEQQALDALNGIKAMTPVLVKKSIQNQVKQASVYDAGITRYATTSEVENGVVTDAAVTPSSMKLLLNEVLRLAGAVVPTGLVMWCTNPDKIPDGWLVCDGSRLIENNDTRDLFNYLKNVKDDPWVNGDAVYLPDLRGRFIRGYHEGNNVRDPELTAFGRPKNDTFKEHDHNVTDPGHKHDIKGKRLDPIARNTPRTFVDYGWSNHDNDDTFEIDDNAAIETTTGISVDNKGGAETRPKNLSLIPIIKL